MTAHNGDYRAALEAVRDALNLPYAATSSGDEARGKVLEARLMWVNVFLRDVLCDRPNLDLDLEIRSLTEQVAKHPPIGYVTDDQAHAALTQGATWDEAVTLPDPTTGGEQR